MNVFSRLALGTSNWNERKPYGHRQVTCPRSEQEKIIEYAHCCGITTLDTATAYDVDLSWVPTAFDIHWKIRKGDPMPPLKNVFLWAHDEEADEWIREKYLRIPWGLSCYEDPLIYREGIQIPYSLFDRRLEHLIDVSWDNDTKVFVRSVFVQGKVFTSEEPVFMRFRQYAGQLGIPVGTLCILFCLLTPHVDKVIVGVDSLGQLKDNLRFFHRLDSFQVDDESITDPRQWGEP